MNLLITYMNDVTPYLLLYSANFVFILTNLYGWMLKAFYKAEPYRDNYDNLFPSRKATEALYLLQIFEIPYLLMLPDPKALFYVNAFSILIFSSLLVVMCDSYFFLKRKNKWQAIRYFLPVILLVFYLLLAAMEIVPTTRGSYQVMFWIITPVFLYYIIRLLVIKRNIRRSIRAVDEGTYSNSDDFPVRYARRIEWVPITICLLMFICFLFNDPYVKMGRDLFFTFVNVWFLLYTLNPHRKGVKREEMREQELEEVLLGADNNTVKYKLPEERKKEIEYKLIELIEKEELFLDSHLTLDHLSQKLGINRNYISETLSGSKYSSFYALINHYRLEYAQELLRRDPSLKIEHAAFDSGFSSINVFTQVFKRYRGLTPSAFVESHIRGSLHAN